MYNTWEKGVAHMLQLKDWEISADISNLNAAFLKRNCDINEIEMLKDKTIPENIFLDIIARNYTLDPQKLEEKLKATLERTSPKKYYRGRICTDCATSPSWQNNVYIGFYVFTTRPSLVEMSHCFKKKLIYNEIIELVASGDLILLSKTPIASKRRILKSGMTPSELETLDSLTLDTMSIEDLSFYGEFITPILKEELNEERIAADIESMVQNAREIALEYYQELTLLLNSLEKPSDNPSELKRTRQKSAEFIAYLDLH